MIAPRQMTHPSTVEDCDSALRSINRFLDDNNDEDIGQFMIYIDMLLDLRLDAARGCREFEL
jgi:hypothetical protein